jgi:hypothetical protein
MNNDYHFIIKLQDYLKLDEFFWKGNYLGIFW